MTLYILITAIALSFIIAGSLRKYTLSKNLLDLPNERSSHIIPTPRGGGLAIVLTTIAGLLLLSSLGRLELPILWVLLGGGIAVAIIGLVDDLGHVAVHWRLFVHFMSAAWVLLMLGGLPQVVVFGSVLDAGLVGDVIVVIGFVWLINLYNFMDGIDGIAASEAVFLAAAGYLFASMSSHAEMQWVAVILVGSTLGFAMWNWPPAKIFMGDVGSGFLGIVLGTYALWSVIESVTSIWIWMILFGVFLVDATFTLLRRSLQGLTWYKAHRAHAYQHAAHRWGHMRVTVGVTLINVIWLFPLAYLAHALPSWGPVLVVLAFVPLIVLVLWLGAGLENRSRKV